MTIDTYLRSQREKGQQLDSTARRVLAGAELVRGGVTYAFRYAAITQNGLEVQFVDVETGRRVCLFGSKVLLSSLALKTR